MYSTVTNSVGVVSYSMFDPQVHRTPWSAISVHERLARRVAARWIVLWRNIPSDEPAFCIYHHGRFLLRSLSARATCFRHAFPGVSLMIYSSSTADSPEESFFAAQLMVIVKRLCEFLAILHHIVLGMSRPLMVSGKLQSLPRKTLRSR